jgi:outer membrane protein W
MRILTTAALALLLAIPALAQHRFIDITANAVWLDPSGGGSFDDLSDPAEIDFKGTLGYGASLNVFVGGRLSLEIAASAVSPDTTVRRRAVGGNPGDFQIIPITGVLQLHLAPNALIDPYIGAGVAYVLFDSLEGGSADTRIERIDFKDDGGFVVNAGLGIRLGNRFGLVIDGKYVPVESSARLITADGSNESDETAIDISPIIVSAGLSLRF